VPTIEDTREYYAELTEAVYLPEMSESLEDRVNEAFSRLHSLENRLVDPGETPQPAENEEKWIKRNWYWVGTLLTLVLGSGVVFGFFHWFFGDLVDHRIAAKLEQPAKDIHQIQLDLARLTQQTEDVDRDVQRLLDKALKATAKLSPDQFKRTLDTTTTQLSIAASLHVPIDVATSEELQARLSGTDPSTPFYWAATAAFVSYRSAGKPKFGVGFDRKDLRQQRDGIKRDGQSSPARDRGPVVG
jgi:hypothetical protein